MTTTARDLSGQQGDVRPDEQPGRKRAVLVLAKKLNGEFTRTLCGGACLTDDQYWDHADQVERAAWLSAATLAIQELAGE